MSSPGSISWFYITMSDEAISLSVSAPGRPPWQAAIPWNSITRVCFAAEGPFDSDGLHIFTDLRPASWAVPVEAEGGADLLNELVRRGLFDAGLAITAALASSGLFCWPPADTRRN
ncbi:MAG TPA: hypothetical protein VF834_22860 [Streptosporangiaceae bacterium]